ncbi:hypothetical protein JCM24511_03860 [Saitozyma sp. JCM 24511]|nr:hypothetical protein JCM24511_03860 [Saitozyma sp. JCM 24511]
MSGGLGLYFLATSSFEYSPGVPIYHSTDLVEWRLIDHALSRPSQLFMRQVDPGGGIYAPTLRYWKGRFYLATCCVIRRGTSDGANPRGFFVYTDDIMKQDSWSDPVFIDNVGIDQDLFFDDDDRVYVCTTRWNPLRGPTADVRLATFCSELDIATGRDLTSPVLVRDSDLSSGIAEGAHIIKKDGWYYLFTAEGGTVGEHQEWVHRSRSPLGPYEPPPSGINPILWDDRWEGLRQAGHADLVTDESGQWWAVFLAIRPQANDVAHLGRETFLAPISWTSDGWPIIARDPASQTGRTMQPRASKNERKSEWTADYSSGFHPQGTLTLYGNAYTILDDECPSMLLRKQTSLSGTWSTLLDFNPTTTVEEAGTAVFWSKWAFMALLVRLGKDRRKEVVLRWTDPEGDDLKVSLILLILVH